MISDTIQGILNICSFLSINVTKSFTFFYYYSSTCFGLTRPSSGVTGHFTEAGFLLCHFFLYAKVPAMCSC
jgi:hypothetical protein